MKEQYNEWLNQVISHTRGDVPLANLAKKVRDGRLLVRDAGNLTIEEKTRMVENALLGLSSGVNIVVIAETDSNDIVMYGGAVLNALADFLMGKYALVGTTRLKSLEGLSEGLLPPALINKIEGCAFRTFTFRKGESYTDFLMLRL